MKKVIFTFFPLPIKLTRKGLAFGRKIHDIQADLWSKELLHKSEWFSNLDQNGHALMRQLTSFALKDEAILDVCCNMGRHLLHLNSLGYNNLHGFDVMGTAIEKLVNLNPGFAKNLKEGNIVDIIPRYADHSFDWAYTHTATIELIHPSFKAQKELARIVRKGVIFLINESGHSYPRFYNFLFKNAGFVTARKFLISNGDGVNLSLYVWLKRDCADKYLHPSFVPGGHIS